MANETVVKTLIFRGSAEGIAELESKVEKLAGSIDGVTIATEQQAKATLSVENAYKRLQTRYDETFRAQNALAQVQKTLQAAQAQGLVSQERAGQLMQQAIVYHNKTAAAQTRVTDTTKLARYELINLSRQIQDVGVSLASGQAFLTVFIQQGSQIADVFASSQGTLKGFASQVGSFLASVFQPARVATGAVIGFGAAAVLAAAQWLEAQRGIQLALLGIGRASGLTVKDINDVADATASLTGLSKSQATEVATTLARTGQIGVAGLKEAVPLAKDYALLLGKSIPEAAQAMAQGLVEPAKSVDTLNDQLGSFDAKTVQLIKDLDAQGNRAAAQRLLFEGMQRGLEGVNQTLSDSSRGWTAFGNLVSNIWTGLGQLFARGLGLEKVGSLEEQLKRLQAEKAALSQPGADLFTIEGMDTAADRLVKIEKAIQAVTRALELEKGKAAEAAATLQAQQVRAAVVAAAPEIGQRETLENRLALLRQQRTELEAGQKTEDQIGFSAKQLNETIRNTAQQLTAVRSQTEQINLDISLALQGAKARTVEDRAQLEFLRARQQANETEEQAQQRAKVVRQQAATAEAEAADQRKLSARQAIESAQLEAQLLGKTVGQQAQLRADLQAKHQLQQEALRDRGDENAIDQQQLANLQRINQGLQTQVDLAEKAKIARDISRERQLLAVTDAEAQIAEKLKDLYPDVATALKSSEAAQLRFNAAIAESGKLAGDFINTFVSGLLEGKSATDALSASLKSLGSAITSSATKDIGKLITGGIGSSGLGTSLGEGLGSLLGTGAAAFGGPLASLGVGAAVTLLGSLFDNSKQKEAEQHAQQLADAAKQANDALQGVVKSFADLTAVASGPVTSAIKNAQQQFEALQQSVASARLAAAQSFFAPGATQTQQALALQQYQQAGAAAADASKQLADFNQRTIDTARESLRGKDSLTAIGQSIADLNAQAKDLQDAMVAAGSSAEDAAAAIGQDLAAAMTRLADNVTKDLVKQINELQGKGFVNQLNDLFATIADAQKAGANPAVIQQFFSLKAQDIVDQAQLTGQAFDDLIKQFPQLQGVVHEFTETIKRSADELASQKQSLQMRLLQATTDQSTLEGQLAIFDADAQRQRLEEQKAGGENMVLLEQTLAAERLQIVQRFEQQRADIIKQASKSIIDYLNGLLTGTQAGASPLARLQAAQRLYNQQIALAQAGDLEALQNITKYAEDLRSAARDYFGSAQGYQDILMQIQTQLGGLATGGTSRPVAVGREIARMQTGGWVRGPVDAPDSVHIMATPDEFVVRPEVARANASWLSIFNATGRMPSAANNNDATNFLLAQIARLIARADVNNVAAMTNTAKTSDAGLRQATQSAQARTGRRVAS